LIDGGADVGERSDGYEGYLARLLANASQQKIDGLSMSLYRRGVLRPARLGKGRLASSGNSLGYGKALMLRFREKAIHEPRAKMSVAPGGGDPSDSDFWAGERQRQSKGVVDVIADIGIEDDPGFGRYGAR